MPKEKKRRGVSPSDYYAPSSRSHRDRDRKETRVPRERTRGDNADSHKADKAHSRRPKSDSSDNRRTASTAVPSLSNTIQVTFDDRTGKKITIPCQPGDSIGSVKVMVGALIGTRVDKFVFKRGAQTFKDQGTLDLYEVHDKTSVEIMYT
ncbi:ubiquitin-like modifier hub1 [Coemansia thaxteri]|nr:ubiquitin-like modifier hub1 [Coemansia thaxteri]KAJ2473360.1 ubiquitin-like modifier hub1 [Coemansia sp. RSA 2322]